MGKKVRAHNSTTSIKRKRLPRWLMPIGGSWYLKLLSFDAKDVYAMKPVSKIVLSFCYIGLRVIIIAKVK